MANEKTLDEQLEEARQLEATRDEAALEQDKRRELLVHQLKAKGAAICAKDAPGVQGRDFQVCEWPALDKVVLLKRAEAIVVKRFDLATKAKGGATDEQTQQYVVACVEHPPRDEFKVWAKEHGQMVHECALELRKLEGLRLDQKAGKR